MKGPLNIGVIGTDTSHSTAFTELLNNPGHAFHVPGGRVISAYAGGSEDFDLSRTRVGQFADKLQTLYGVKMRTQPEQVAEEADAILLLAADGRLHKEMFERIARFPKPVFIDKPFAVSYSDAKAMADMASEAGIPIMSSSALRFEKTLTDELQRSEGGGITGAACYGPMAMESTQKGYFWYGIHSIEMLYTIMGTGCRYVYATSTSEPGNEEIIVAEWDHGKLGTVRGSRFAGTPFAALIHREEKHVFVDIAAGSKPFYASLLEQVMTFFRGESHPLDISITLEIMRFIEAANESRATGQKVSL